MKIISRDAGLGFLFLALASNQVANGFLPAAPRTAKEGRGIRMLVCFAASKVNGPFGLSWSVQNPFAGLGVGKVAQEDPDIKIRAQLKQELLELCKAKESKDKRKLIEETIEALAKLSPTTEPSKSVLLRKEWLLVWTTENEINFFIEKGWSLQIGQTLGDSVLSNWIPFVNGGGLEVKGTIEADQSNALRTNFKFDTATLDLAKWGSYKLPPIGQGWFDTVYLDSDFRVDLNSRSDILICKADSSAD